MWHIAFHMAIDLEPERGQDHRTVWPCWEEHSGLHRLDPPSPTYENIVHLFTCAYGKPVLQAADVLIDEATKAEVCSSLAATITAAAPPLEPPHAAAAATSDNPDVTAHDIATHPQHTQVRPVSLS